MAQEFEAIQPAALSIRAISSNSWIAGVGAISRPPNARGIQVRKMPASTMAAIAALGRFRAASANAALSRSTGSRRLTTSIGPLVTVVVMVFPPLHKGPTKIRRL